MFCILHEKEDEDTYSSGSTNNYPSLCPMLIIRVKICSLLSTFDSFGTFYKKRSYVLNTKHFLIQNGTFSTAHGMLHIRHAPMWAKLAASGFSFWRCHIFIYIFLITVFYTGPFYSLFKEHDQNQIQTWSPLLSSIVKPIMKTFLAFR
jgi:hypothetical protein